MIDPEIAKAILVLREDPLALDAMLFSDKYSLFPHQRHMMRTLEKHPHVFIQAARASAKSYTVSRYLCGYCLRFPDTRVIFSGPTYRQSKTTWRYARDILFNESPFSWKELLSKEPTESAEQAVIQFQNGSQMIALPASGTKLHGKRASVIVLTEFFDYPESLYAMTVLPMAAKRMHRERSNKLIWETTAGFEFSFAYSEYKRVTEEIERKNPDYALVSIDIDTLIREQWEVETEIIEITRKIDQDTYLQQYENKWLSDVGSYYVLSIMMAEDLKRCEVLLKGKPDAEYVMSLDTARSGRGTGDDSAIAIIEVATPPKIVYLWSQNNITAEELAKEVVRLIDRFPSLSNIILDKQGGGEYVLDDLRSMGYIEIAPEHRIPGRELITPFSHTAENINRGHMELRSAFENGDIDVPRRPESEDPNIQIAYNEIVSALRQLADLQISRMPSGWYHFDAPPRKKKDRAYALMYAFWGVRRILEDRMQQNPEAIDLGSPVVESKFGEVLIGLPNA